MRKGADPQPNCIPRPVTAGRSVRRLAGEVCARWWWGYRQNCRSEVDLEKSNFFDARKIGNNLRSLARCELKFPQIFLHFFRKVSPPFIACGCENYSDHHYSTNNHNESCISRNCCEYEEYGKGGKREEPIYKTCRLPPMSGALLKRAQNRRKQEVILSYNRRLFHHVSIYSEKFTICKARYPNFFANFSACRCVYRCNILRVLCPEMLAISSIERSPRSESLDKASCRKS